MESATKVSAGVVLQGVDRPPELVQLVRHLDQHFDHLWMTDSSLHARNPYQCLTVAAMHSDRLTLGTAVTNPVTRHPAITAVAAASLDEVSGGRAILGIGVGDRPLAALGQKPATLRTLEDSIDVIRRLLAGHTIDFASSAFQLVDAHVRFPAERVLPVFVSATGPRTLELAGRVADGVILLCGISPEVLEWALAHIDRGAAAAERPRPRIAVFLYGSINEDEDRAVRDARAIAAWFPQTSPTYCDLVGLDPRIAAEVRSRYDGGEFQEAGAAAEILPVDFVRKMALAGNRERIAGQLEGIIGLGIDSVNVFPLGSDRLATIDAFAACCHDVGL